jgi:hypothetical protein
LTRQEKGKHRGGAKEKEEKENEDTNGRETQGRIMERTKE